MDVRIEDTPLLDDDKLKINSFTKRQGEAYLQFDNAIFDDDSDNEVQSPTNNVFPAKEQSYPGRKPMIVDAVCIILDFLQYYALIQSLALRWVWPRNWTSSLSFMFFFNLDFWEFAKIQSGAYIPARDVTTPSALVPFSYKWWLIAWYIILCGIVLGFFLAHRYLKRREISKGIGYGTVLHKVALVLGQVLALPLGVQLGKVFWCNPVTDDGQVLLNVSNDVTCWTGDHIIFVILSLIVLVLAFPAYAVWLYLSIKSQIVTFDHRRHEAYLQLKDCEYRYGLDHAWTARVFISFASYRRRWAYTRPLLHLIKFVIICFYAGLFNYRLAQISVLAAIFFLLIFVTYLPRQYRVTSYNFLAMWCWLALFGNSITGVLMNIDDLESAFTTTDYVRGELLLINIGWVVVVVAWVIYIILRAKKVLCARTPLWPTMMSQGVRKLPQNTLRYMSSALEGRFAIKKCVGVPALLAPVHDLAHHIHVINALACEAEYVKDPMQSSLRDVLDDLIELHGRVAPHSLFSESLKPSVHSTVQDLLKVLPEFTKRLQQREFDFIMTSPKRRRLLLKLFIVSCFLSRSRSRKDATGGEEGRGGTSAVLKRLWRPPSTLDSSEGDRQSVSDEGFVGDDHDGSENEIFAEGVWYDNEKRRQTSVIISPTPDSAESIA